MGPKQQQQPDKTQRQASGKQAAATRAAAGPAKVAVAAPRQVAAAAPRQVAAAAPRQVADATGAATAARTAAAPAPAAKKMRQTTITRRRAAAPPTPPAKYPALNELKNAYFDMGERVNQANESGKLAVRATRNAMSGMLTSPSFWTAAAAVTGKLGKWTNDERKAELRVRMCDAVTDALTRPAATDDYEQVAEQVYQAVASVDIWPWLELAQDAVDAVEYDEVVRALDEARRTVDAVNLNPAMVTKGFNLVNRFMSGSGLVTMNNGVINGISRLSMTLNRNASVNQR